MIDTEFEAVRNALDTLYRSESGRILATLIRMLGDLDLAEEAMQDAFTAALHQWPSQGIPPHPRAWLISTARFKAIDQVRQQMRLSNSKEKIADQLYTPTEQSFPNEEEGLEDDRLRLIFTCCHPLLPPEARVALTLREVCGLTTEEIARAFLTSAPTLAQRIVRAKAKIREAKIPYRVPESEELPSRLQTVLQVVYLVFNEGYSASSGSELTRVELSAEAIRLGRLLLELLPEPEVMGLLALMLIQESRRAARTTSSGDIVLLEDQDRNLWNRTLIEEGIAWVEEALKTRRFGSYTLQAAIAAVHAESPSPASTDWKQIVVLYNKLAELDSSPIVALNRAVAVAMDSGPKKGLLLIEALFAEGHLVDYALAHSARGELCRRLGEYQEAQVSYHRALDLTHLEPERRLLEKRLQAIAKEI